MADDGDAFDTLNPEDMDEVTSCSVSDFSCNLMAAGV